MVNVIKRPENENDMFLLTLSDFQLSNKQLSNLQKTDEYLMVKTKQFENQNIEKEAFSRFTNRPSFRNWEKINKLEGTIYTYAVKDRNGVSYMSAMYLVKEMLKKNPKTKRCILRIANSLNDYFLSEIDGKDVSCLSMIHYKKDSVCLTFRASDIENELFVDLITIYNFFIKPIYDRKINIEIFASTGQNVNKFNKFTNKVKNL